MLLPVEKARFNTVQHFDRLIRVSERVLDRSICPEIDRVHPVDTNSWETLSEAQKRIRQEATLKKRQRQRDALEAHCKARVKTEGLDYSECNLD